jgi:N-acetylneuraminic acid mutarotase
MLETTKMSLMSSPWRRLFSSDHFRASSRRKSSLHLRLEELETRLTPASYAVSAQLAISHQDSIGATPGGAHAVVFFEANVADYQVLRQGLDTETDAVVLDSTGDGLKEMAAFLAGRHDLTAVGVVAHGAPGAVALGGATLNGASFGNYSKELAMVGSALGEGGELDLWSCNVGAGDAGETLVKNLAVTTGAGVAAARHEVGAGRLGGDWQLDCRVAGAQGEDPFSADARGAFNELLDTWNGAAPMSSARRQFTATLLPNGKVLVVGGFDGTVMLSSAELYDSATNTWSSAGSLAVARTGHTAALLPNGKVLVAGGVNGNTAPGTTLSSAELYDPVSSTWSSAAPMSTARTGHTATALSDGKVLVAGGSRGSSASVLSSAEIYDPVGNTWTNVGAMAVARQNHTATRLANGKVLVVGGLTIYNGVVSTAELYDPASKTWSSAGSLGEARVRHGAALLNTGKVLVAGGANGSVFVASAELYDPATNSWSAATSMSMARGWFSASLLGNGKVLVEGGWTPSTNDLSSAELYDAGSNTWSAAGSMITARDSQTATFLPNGQVLVAGGEIPDGTSWVPVASAELYTLAGPVDPSQSTITVSPPTIQLGGTSTITLTAKDATGYPEGSGGLTVTFGLGAGSGSGTLTGFTDNNNGTYAATFTGTATGPITITGTINGNPVTSALPTINVAPAAPATHFTVTSVASVTAGNPAAVTVTAVDANGLTVPGYTGTVHFNSSDLRALLPANYTFTAGDAGVHSFSATLNTAGLQSLTATDGAGLAGQTGIQVSAAAATHFALSGPTSVGANTAFSITVTAYDAYGNVATGYRGTVHFSDSGNGSTLPPNYTFTATDSGVHLFSGVKLKQKGKHTIMVVDTMVNTIIGTWVINVT